MAKYTFEEARKIAENILNDLPKGLKYRYSGYSETNGQSMYFNVFKEGDELNAIKVRFSDHRVTNIDRVVNEVHFSWENIKQPNSLNEIGYRFNIDGFEYKKVNVVTEVDVEFNRINGRKILRERDGRFGKIYTVEKKADLFRFVNTKENVKNTEALLNNLDIKKAKFIEKNILFIGKESAIIQKKLLDLITQDFVSQLEYVDGALVNSVKNYQIINNFDNVLNDFQDTYMKPLVSNIGESILELTPINAEYYKILGANKTTVEQLVKKLRWLNERIGVDKKGNVISGSYLDNLATAPELRTELKDYVIKNVVNESGIKDFQKGFKTLLSDSDNVDGAMKKYYKQYTFDTFNSVDETINSYMADSLNLKYFVYSGTLIKTSRCFCRKRQGKVFSTEDTLNWVNDPTLPKTPNYNPLIDRGSYNCRHNIRYISEERAIELGYSKEVAKSVVYETCKENKGK